MAAALGMFTLMPARFVEVDRPLARRAIMLLPWLGLVLGLVAGGLAGLTCWRDGSLLASVVGLAVLIGAVGAMHLDGLADTADGLGSRRPAEGALEVMRRSDIGPMGVSSIVVVLLVDTASLAALGARGVWGLVAALALGPMVGRLAAMMATREGLASARSSGFGALFVGGTPPATVALSVLALLVVAGAAGSLAGWAQMGALGGADPSKPGGSTLGPLGAWLGTFGTTGALGFAGAAVVALIVGELWRRHLAHRLGGMTGDTLGSLIEVSQAAFWLALALVA